MFTEAVATGGREEGRQGDMCYTKYQAMQAHAIVALTLFLPNIHMFLSIHKYLFSSICYGDSDDTDLCHAETVTRWVYCPYTMRWMYMKVHCQKWNSEHATCQSAIYCTYVQLGVTTKKTHKRISYFAEYGLVEGKTYWDTPPVLQGTHQQ